VEPTIEKLIESLGSGGGSREQEGGDCFGRTKRRGGGSLLWTYTGIEERGHYNIESRCSEGMGSVKGTGRGREEKVPK